MARSRTRIYWRHQGGARRAYADFRDFADVGGRREALVVPGERVATGDDQVAERLAAQRLEALLAARHHRGLTGVGLATLRAAAAAHLVAKERSGRFTDRHLANVERQLERACAYFEDLARRRRDSATLLSVGTGDVEAWIEELRGRGLAGGTLRHHLNSLSNLYRRAQSDRAVPPGFNPAAAVMEKPRANRAEARWLEVSDAALLLEAARTHTPARAHLAMPFAYELLATFLLTGGRRAEVLGLEVGDVNFDRRTITFRENRWRRLKTATSRRVVPLWPQLEEILRPYRVRLGLGAEDRLLFPSTRHQVAAVGAAAHVLTEPRKLLDAIAARGGWKAGEVRTKALRHTYCAARLQTLDRGAPVSAFTVARELGHGGRSLVDRVYGHLGEVRHRADVVEYRVEQHQAQLGERLLKLRRVG